MIIHGSADTVVPAESVVALSERLASQKRITINRHLIPDANHFFHDKIELLTDAVGKYVDDAFAEAAAASE